MDVSTFSCSFQGCGKSFKRKCRLDVHARTHTGERPFVCNFDGCKSSYARSQHLTRHIERSHTSGHKELSKVRCSHCNLELANSYCLKKHVLSFHGAQTNSKEYKCPEEGCKVSFHKKKQLVVHQLNAHSTHLFEASKCYSCPHEGCGKLFTFPNKLKIHLKTHNGYACNVEGCSKVLPNWSSLRKHRTVDHTPAHTCTTCGATFKHKGNWNQHIKIHSVSQKPHACPHKNCGRLFLYKKNLTQHIRAYHDGETVWRRSPKKQSNIQHKKQRVSRKKSMAARLCGYDDRRGEVSFSQRSPDHGQESELSQDHTVKTISNIFKSAVLATSRSNITDDTDISSTPDSFRVQEDTQNSCSKDVEENRHQPEFITLLAL